MLDNDQNDQNDKDNDRLDSDMGILEPANLSCGVEKVHAAHSWHVPGADYVVCAGVDLADDDADDLGTYVDMFRQYREDQRHWIGPAQAPLVFHIAKLCRKLDSDPDAPTSLSSAYLQAVQRLDRQRPGNKQPAGNDGDLPGQRSIFDELDD